jgi:ABC-2 type transport system permease protein
MTIMAIIFIYIFGYSFDQTYVPEVYIIDEDKTTASSWVIDKLSDSESFEFNEVDYEEGIEGLKAGNVMSVIYLQEGFEEGLNQNESRVILYKNTSAIELMTLESTVLTTLSEMKMNVEFSRNMAIAFNNEGIEITEEAIYTMVENEKSLFPVIEIISQSYEGGLVAYNSQKHSFAGFIVFFSLFTIMFGIGTIVDEKENRGFARQLVSPVTARDIIIGNLFGNFILGSGQIAIIILVTKLLLGMEWGGSTLALLLVLGAFIAAGTAIGLMVTGLVKTQQQLSAVLPTFIVSTSMLGGCMWPLEIIHSKALLFIANLTPQRWAMMGVENVITYNGTLVDVVRPIGFLLMITVIFLLISVFVYKKGQVNRR